MRRWKLSPMDLESIARWEDYSRAKDEMFAHTDIPEAPWFVVETDDKRRARINMIAHLLASVPYRQVPLPGLELPQRPPRPRSTSGRRTSCSTTCPTTPPRCDEPPAERGQRRPANRSCSGSGAPVRSWTRTKVSRPMNSANRSLPIRRKKMFSLWLACAARASYFCAAERAGVDPGGDLVVGQPDLRARLVGVSAPPSRRPARASAGRTPRTPSAGRWSSRPWPECRSRRPRPW